MRLAEYDIQQGRPQVAIERLAPLRDRLEGQGLPADRAVEARAQMEAGNEARAAEIIDAARSLALSGGARRDLVDVLLVSAELAIRQERWDDGLRDLEDGLRVAREIGLPYKEACLLREYGRLHSGREKPAPRANV